MKATLLISGLFCFLTQGLQAQLTPFQKNGKWGYKNNQQEIVVPPKYDTAEPFKDGIAKVSTTGNKVWWDGWHQRDNWGMINASGEVIIPLEYTQLETQEDGLIKARKTPKNSNGAYDFDPDGDRKNNGDKWGYINRENEVIVPFNYRYLEDFFSDDPSGNLVFGGVDYRHWAVIDRKGKEVVSAILSKKPEKSRYSEGFFYIESDSKKGIIDTSGKVIIEPKYDYVSAHKVGYYIWIVDNKKHGVIDWSGNIVVPIAFDQVSPTHQNDQFWVQKNGKEMLFNAYDEAPFTEKFDNLESTEHHWFVATKNEKVGLLNASGQLVFPAEYDDIKIYPDGNVRVQKGDLFGMKDSTLRTLVETKYKTLYYSDLGYSFVSNDFNAYTPIDMPTEYTPTNFFVIDNTGKRLVKAKKYDDFVAFSEDFIWGQKDGKWYLLSLKTGRPHIKQGFVALGGFDEQQGLVDRHGRSKDLTLEQSMVGRSLSTITTVMNDSLWGAVNLQGEQILTCQFDYIAGEYNRVRVEKDDLWGVYTDSGELLIPLKYGYMGEFRKPYKGDGPIEAKFWNPDQKTGGYIDLEGNERPW